jgi:retron-type reverse transcriptase
MEPRLVALLRSWLRQDVMFRGQRIRRERGLAQGSALSPLLANLYLDEFDETLQEGILRDITQDMIPEESWLTHVDFRKVRALGDECR